MVSPPEPWPPQAGLWCGCHVRRPNVRLFWFGIARTETGSTLDAVRMYQLEMPWRPDNQPQLRISLEMFAVEGDGRLPRSESVSDEAGENMDHGVHGRPVA